jgi:HPt (histidine-containing phosphotransfer) domain-containing protein
LNGCNNRSLAARALREVHTLASSTRSVGLLRVGQAAADIEEAMATEDPNAERLAALLDLMRESIARLGEWEAAQPAMLTEAT